MSILIRNGLVLANAESDATRADLLIEGDRIARIGPDLEVDSATDLLDASNHLVMPGLVNSHTHAHNHLVKGAIDQLPLEIWAQHLVARSFKRSPRDVYVGAAIGAIEMAKTGTTCVCEMAQVMPGPTDETMDAVAQAYADVGLRACIAAQVSDLPFYEAFPDLAARLPSDLLEEVAARPRASTEEIVATIARAIDRWHGQADGRIHWSLGPSFATICSPELLEASGQLARDHDLVLQTHLSETKIEAYTARQRYGQSFTAYLHQLGLLGPRTVLAHCVWLDNDELDLIAASGASVAHNPFSNLKLGSGIAPIPAMRERGINLVLGTDGSASSDNLNLFAALRLAAILPRVVDPEYERWPGASDVLRMATMNGARAAGFEGQVGTIAPGMKADLALLELSSTYFHPRNNLPNQLVYCEVGSSVRTVLVDGRVVVRDGRLTTVDEAALLAEADEIAQRETADLEQSTSLVRRLQPHLRQAYLEVGRAPWPINRYASDAYRDLPSD